MADFFTHFSCLLDVRTPENAARALDLYNRMMEENAAEDPPSEAFLLSIQPEHGALMECADALTGEARYVICAVGRDGTDFVFTPFGHLADGNPFDAYVPPSATLPDEPAP